MARVIRVIETIEGRGEGTKENPIRMVRSYWSFDGELLGESLPPRNDVGSNPDAEPKETP